jgi:hypothetical protein
MAWSLIIGVASLLPRDDGDLLEVTVQPGYLLGDHLRNIDLDLTVIALRTRPLGRLR